MNERPDAIESEKVPPFVGLFGGALVGWIVAELAIRGVPFEDVLHVVAALVAGAIGWIVGWGFARRSRGRVNL